MQNAVENITMTTTPASFDDFDSIQPIISWADLVGESEYDPSGVVIPSWADMDLAMMDAEVPEPSARVQRRVENPAESSDRRVYSQKSDCPVWRKHDPSSSDFRVRSSRASEARIQSRRNNIGFPQEERMGGAKFSSKAPTTAIPPSQDWRRLPPQDFVRFTARPVQDASPPQHRGPATSSSENGAGPLQNKTPAKTVAQKQEMGGQNKTIKAPITTPPSQDWRRLPPQDFVRFTARPVQDASPPQHQGPASSSSENGAGPLQNTTPAKTVAQKQELGGQKLAIKPPITPTPAPEPEHKSLPSRLFKKALTEAGPRRPKAYPAGFFKRLEAAEASPPQHQGPNSSSSENGAGSLQNTTPAKTVAQKQELGGQKLAIKPPITPTPAPEPEHKSLPSRLFKKALTEAGPRRPKAYPPGFFKRLEATEASPPQHQGPASSSSENGAGSLQNTTPAKTVAQKQELGGQKLAIKPPITPTPAPEPEHKSLPSRLFKKALTEAGPRRPKAYPPGFFKRLEATEASPPQNMTLPSDFNQKLRAALKNTPLLQPKPYPPGFFNRLEPTEASPPQNMTVPSDFDQKLRAALKNTPLLQPKPYPPGFFNRLEPTEASPPQNVTLPSYNQKLRAPLTKTPLFQHQNLSSSSPSVIGVSPQKGQKKTTAKTFPQRQGMRSSFKTECSLEDLCYMLDGLHLSEKPTLSLTPDSPRPLLRPASFIYKTQPKFGFSQHQKGGQEILKNPHAPPTPANTSEILPAPHLNPQPILNDKNLIRKLLQLLYDS